MTDPVYVRPRRPMEATLDPKKGRIPARWEVCVIDPEWDEAVGVMVLTPDQFAEHFEVVDE
jgi:hypothetical protein